MTSDFVDFSNPNSPGENRLRGDLLRQAKRKKAEMGIAVTPCPVGYIKGPNRTWVKDPDLRVRKTIQRIFDEFPELGSAGAVWRNFRRAGHQAARTSPKSRRQTELAERGSCNDRPDSPQSGLRGNLCLREDRNRSLKRSASERATAPPVTHSPNDQMRICEHHASYAAPSLWAQIERQMLKNRKGRPAAGPGGPLA